MIRILPLESVTAKDKTLVGGKAFALARLAGKGFAVPRSLCVTTDAYAEYINTHGVAERIQLELNRKDFADMRWEEVWDTALRIRHLFISIPMPPALEEELGKSIQSFFRDAPVAIRSSSPEEDSSKTSFAGLHESFIHISGKKSIVDHIKLVWASLWSDAALLYRRELGLSTENSTMGVLLQEVVPGRVSGILFTRSPGNAAQAVIESVYGMNQALVDGVIEPDRWFVSRDDENIEFVAATHGGQLKYSESGLAIQPIPEYMQLKPSLHDGEIKQLIKAGMAIENMYNCPQDIEWTITDDKLTILQARPISTIHNEKSQDKRSWYLSLHRSLDNLRALREKIEHVQLPAMAREAEQLSAIDLSSLTDVDLADEIERRQAISEKWTSVYWEDFIPFAHGMRLFGQVYNDSVRPEDPYEFMELLVSTPLISTDRNAKLYDMAELVRRNPDLAQQLEQGAVSDFIDDDFQQSFNEFVQMYGDLSCTVGLEGHCRSDVQTLLAVILATASLDSKLKREREKSDQEQFVEKYLHSFPGEKREEAGEILEIGRASYRLRDDDNMYLGRIEQQVARAFENAHQRLEKDNRLAPGKQLDTAVCLKALRDASYVPIEKQRSLLSVKTTRYLKARQLVGQPAGPGIAHGKALVVSSNKDLLRLKKGDVLVCDAIEPHMTFVVPLAGAIIERRGGMLIHGAIIAREYGIPCVTGITDAVNLIYTGDKVSVDGYLGIVTVAERKDR